MLKRTLGVTIAAALTVGITAAASAASARNHSFTSVSRLATISNSKRYPKKGSTAPSAVINVGSAGR
jgi:hypothetical protein